jgi:hypothetical protein
LRASPTLQRTNTPPVAGSNAARTASNGRPPTTGTATSSAARHDQHPKILSRACPTPLCVMPLP